MTDLQVADVGVVIELEITDGTDPIDVSAATTIEIIIKRSGSASITKTATFTTTGVDGKIRFTTVATDFAQVGEYGVQAHIVLGAQDWRTTVAALDVAENL